MSYFFFFCKQKTAYEMRISDWSSDVCSSDLLEVDERRLERRGQRAHLDIVARHDARPQLLRHRVGAAAAGDGARRFGELAGELGEIGRASCRDRVCQYV